MTAGHTTSSSRERIAMTQLALCHIIRTCFEDLAVESRRRRRVAVRRRMWICAVTCEARLSAGASCELGAVARRAGSLVPTQVFQNYAMEILCSSSLHETGCVGINAVACTACNTARSAREAGTMAQLTLRHIVTIGL